MCDEEGLAWEVLRLVWGREGGKKEEGTFGGRGHDAIYLSGGWAMVERWKRKVR